jgi:Xaa-Pro aminopeptidase
MSSRIGSTEYADRMAGARQRMEEVGIDCLALTAGADLFYLTGYKAMPLERITMLIVGAYGEPTLVVPALEAPRVQVLDGLFRVHPWNDGEDMVGVLACALRKASPPNPTIALSEQTGAGVLLALADRMRHTRFVGANRVMRELRMRKSAAELDLLRDAAAAVDAVVADYKAMRWAGRTEREIADEIGVALRGAGHETVNFVIVASGPNAASPHHDPGLRRVEVGDTIVVDVGGTKNGYCSDVTRCVAVGEPAPGVVKAYASLRRAQEAAVAAVCPGARASDIDAVARGHLTDDGYGGYFVHRTGHGIGLDAHEEPYIVAGNTETLESGMCFSVEPGIYVPGEFGLRLEDIVAVTPDGVTSLNTAPHDIVVADPTA